MLLNLFIVNVMGISVWVSISNAAAWPAPHSCCLPSLPAPSTVSIEVIAVRTHVSHLWPRLVGHWFQAL